MLVRGCSSEAGKTTYTKRSRRRIAGKSEYLWDRPGWGEPRTYALRSVAPRRLGIPGSPERWSNVIDVSYPGYPAPPAQGLSRRLGSVFTTSPPRVSRETLRGSANEDIGRPRALRSRHRRPLIIAGWAPGGLSPVVACTACRDADTYPSCVTPVLSGASILSRGSFCGPHAVPGQV